MKNKKCPTYLIFLLKVDSILFLVERSNKFFFYCNKDILFVYFSKINTFKDKNKKL